MANPGPERLWSGSDGYASPRKEADVKEQSMDLGGTVSGLGDSLQNIDFPASKDDVVSSLQNNNSLQETIY